MFARGGGGSGDGGWQLLVLAKAGEAPLALSTRGLGEDCAVLEQLHLVAGVASAQDPRFHHAGVGILRRVCFPSHRHTAQRRAAPGVRRLRAAVPLLRLARRERGAAQHAGQTARPSGAARRPGRGVLLEAHLGDGVERGRHVEAAVVVVVLRPPMAHAQLGEGECAAAEFLQLERVLKLEHAARHPAIVAVRTWGDVHLVAVAAKVDDRAARQ